MTGPVPAVAPVAPSVPRVARNALLILTGINLLNYVDRYVVSALVGSLKGDPTAGGLGLSDLQAGSLATAFLAVYMLTSGIFGALGDRSSRPRLIALGVGIWSVATALGGFAWGFASLFVARALVGVGEAAYGTISPPLLADLYAPERRGRAFSVFFAAIPIGAALGFILGGFMDKHFGWRAAFWVAGSPGLVLALLALTLPDPPRGGLDPKGAGETTTPAHGGRPAGGIAAAYGPLLRNRSYLLIVLGYAAATFAAGGLAFWMPEFLHRVRHLDNEHATAWFGGITVAGGLLGTYAGGVVGDRLLKRSRHAYVWMSGVTTLLAVPLVILALTLESFPLYMSAIFVGELLIFASTGPVNSAIVGSVPPNRRVAAMALSIFLIHLLGDVPSPPLIGSLSDATSLGIAVLLVPAAVTIAGIVWIYAAIRAERLDRAAAAEGKP